MIYKPFDIVVVSFPFTDTSEAKRRPAIVLSSYQNFGAVIRHSTLAMITSARNTPWPLDAAITNLETAGLQHPSVIRMKFFTLDHRLIIKTIGTLSEKDRANLSKKLGLMFKEVL